MDATIAKMNPYSTVTTTGNTNRDLIIGVANGYALSDRPGQFRYMATAILIGATQTLMLFY